MLIHCLFIAGLCLPLFLPYPPIYLHFQFRLKFPFGKSIFSQQLCSVSFQRVFILSSAQILPLWLLDAPPCNFIRARVLAYMSFQLQPCQLKKLLPTVADYQCLRPASYKAAFIKILFISIKNQFSVLMRHEKNLSHDFSLKLKKENICRKIQVGQGSNALTPGRKLHCSCLPQPPQMLQVQLELLPFTT